MKEFKRFRVDIMRFPNTLDPNIYHAYNYNHGGVARKPRQSLDAMNLNWDINLPESLVELCIKAIADNWGSECCLFQYI